MLINTINDIMNLLRSFIKLTFALVIARPTKEYGRICHLYQVGANRPTAANHTTRRRD